MPSTLNKKERKKESKQERKSERVCITDLEREIITEGGILDR